MSGATCFHASKNNMPFTTFARVRYHVTNDRATDRSVRFDNGTRASRMPRATKRNERSWLTAEEKAKMNKEKCDKHGMQYHAILFLSVTFLTTLSFFLSLFKMYK